MPYGVDKKLGGDNDKNDAWMERCVNHVMKGQNRSKASAIAICKAQMKKMHESKASFDGEIEVEPSIFSKEFNFRVQYITKNINNGMTYEQALHDYEAHLAKNDFEIGA